MYKTYLFLAEGFEDIEALAAVDILRRGGVEVLTVSITDSLEVKSAHGVVVKADLHLEEVDEEVTHCLVFPGGMPGAENLANCAALMELLQRHHDRDRYVAAICAAPAMVLSHLKRTEKLHLTCYPGFEKYVPDAVIETGGVVVNGRVVTGKGPGYAVEFALVLLEELCGKEVAAQVAAGMLIK